MFFAVLSRRLNDVELIVAVKLGPAYFIWTSAAFKGSSVYGQTGPSYKTSEVHVTFEYLAAQKG